MPSRETTLTDNSSNNQWGDRINSSSPWEDLFECSYAVKINSRLILIGPSAGRALGERFPLVHSRWGSPPLEGCWWAGVFISRSIPPELPQGSAQAIIKSHTIRNCCVYSYCRGGTLRQSKRKKTGEHAYNGNNIKGGKRERWNQEKKKGPKRH